eukprot:3359174-Rhodomonas_salina.2
MILWFEASSQCSERLSHGLVKLGGGPGPPSRGAQWSRHRRPAAGDASDCNVIRDQGQGRNHWQSTGHPTVMICPRIRSNTAPPLQRLTCMCTLRTTPRSRTGTLAVSRVAGSLAVAVLSLRLVLPVTDSECNSNFIHRWHTSHWQ